MSLDLNELERSWNSASRKETNAAAFAYEHVPAMLNELRERQDADVLLRRLRDLPNGDV